MDRKISEAVALLRHQIISPVLMETGRSQMKYFRSLEDREFDVPGLGPRRFKASTMKMWLRNYKQHGFSGITPRPRSDAGGMRRLSPQDQKKLLDFRSEWPDISVALFYKKCLKEDILQEPVPCLATLRRFLQLKGLSRPASVQARKRFEMGTFGELWTGDYMHGPKVKLGRLRKKAILFAIVDDHSRLIVGARWGTHENTISIEQVFKEAILAYGLPDRLYVDNGPSFSSQYLARACANLGVGLVHSKPYDSPSRGKIERFFRTVRSGFLAQFRPEEVLTLEQLNSRFKVWLREDYHRAFHGGIKGRPLDRYTISNTAYPRKQVDPDLVEEYFMVSIERTVKKDATISYDGKLFEVPARYIGQKIELRHPQSDACELFLYEDGQRVAHAAPLDAIENGRIFRPKHVEQVSFTEAEEL